MFKVIAGDEALEIVQHSLNQNKLPPLMMACILSYREIARRNLSKSEIEAISEIYSKEMS